MPPTTAVEPHGAPQPQIESHARQPPLVAVIGPTASGKTTLAVDLAQQCDGEIVSADSRQLYRYMDIGTAKPTTAEQAAVPHHLIDVVTPDHNWTLAQYQRAAYAAIAGIHARSRVPLLVGGTGQYVTAVIEGWGIPEVAPNPVLRAELETFADEHGARALHNRLREADPDAAARIDYRNIRRVVRALEVFLETGTPITILQRKSPPPYRILQIGLTLDRAMLYTRIDARIDRMLAAGLLDEVRSLLERGYNWDCPAMSGLGYAQWRDCLAGIASEQDAVAAIRRETRAFARRQYTWFNGHDTGTRWFDIAHTPPSAIVATALDWLGRTNSRENDG